MQWSHFIITIADSGGGGGGGGGCGGVPTRTVAGLKPYTYQAKVPGLMKLLNDKFLILYPDH